MNGTPVLSGPCKGDLNRQYYETVELTPYLSAGKNVFAVQVLYNDPDIARDQMDTRLQMLFTYAVSNDTGLVKKALLDFHCGMQPGGLLTGKAPARGKLPVLLPADMETVETHCEDRADDITPYIDSCGNIYRIGFGLG